jgi:hypothetical protein
MEGARRGANRRHRIHIAMMLNRFGTSPAGTVAASFIATSFITAASVADTECSAASDTFTVSLCAAARRPQVPAHIGAHSDGELDGDREQAAAVEHVNQRMFWTTLRTLSDANANTQRRAIRHAFRSAAAGVNG